MLGGRAAARVNSRMTSTLRYTQALLLPGDTIWGVLFKHNRHDVTPAERAWLLERYLELNGSAVPRAGQSIKVPLLPRHATH
jgi:hypothetical protein